MRHARRTMLTALLACVVGPGALAATDEQLAAFFRAVQTDDTRTVGAMLGASINPNQRNPVGGEPALVLAVREDAMRVFAQLLAHPALAVDTPAANGNTALMMAAYKGNQPAVDALLAKGAQVNRPGWTALHYAAAGGHDAIARQLLARGAQVDALSPPASGAMTPLMMAAREGHDRTAIVLIDHGANGALTNTEGLTAVLLAERAGKRRVAEAIAARLRR